MNKNNKLTIIVTLSDYIVLSLVTALWLICNIVKNSTYEKKFISAHNIGTQIKLLLIKMYF